MRLKATAPNRLDCALAALDERVDAELAELKGMRKLAGVAAELPDAGGTSDAPPATPPGCSKGIHG